MTYSPETMERMERSIRVATVKKSDLGDDWTAEAHVEPLDTDWQAAHGAWPEGAGPRFPGVTVQLTGEDGNGFTIVSRVRRHLERHLVNDLGESIGESRRAGQEFFDEALSGNYDHLLATVMEWVNVK